MVITREDEADVACAVEGFPFVAAVYALDLGDRARAHPDALTFAVVLCPYGVNELVLAHYALVEATDGREIPGRILYVNAEAQRPAPLAHARRILLDPVERDAALTRIALRRARAATRPVPAIDRRELALAFGELAQRADGGFARSSITATLRSRPVLEVERDPFPPKPRPRVLVVDDDSTTEEAMAALDGVDAVLVTDGWSAIDRLTSEPFDLAICAVIVAGFSGAQIHRVVAKSHPEMASRIVFLASADAVSRAPPSAARGRVLTRPLDPADVLALLGHD